MQDTSVRPDQYLQDRPTQNKVVFVRQVVIVRRVHPAPSNVTLGNIALTRDYMSRMRTVPLVFTAGPAQNLHDRMIIQLEMLVRRVRIVLKGVTTSRSVHLELFRIQQTTHELKIVYNVPWGAIAPDGVTRTLLGYVIRVFTVPKVS